MHEKPLRGPRVPRLTVLVLTGALLSAPVLPHGGGLNSAGCHNDYVNGGYHCHRGGDDEASIDSDVVLAVLLASGIVYFVHKLKKNKKKRRDPERSFQTLGLTRSVEVPGRDPVALGLVPVTNSRGRVDGVGFQFRFRF
ncbi:MAG: hypothetical protein F4060_09395 [Holophagales bacterium]|nr:hypothetical protein [Holophagales bacterium]MYG31022.1 hypothetical protein [Holophagales bacterium]MYI80146.1 hypothetical protein [Holophagales bacterium]